MSDETKRFFEIVASGRSNTTAEWHAYLEAFHNELPRANELFALPVHFSGETSYALLAKAAKMTGAKRVLDLGCGDGNLLEELIQALPADARLTGIDISSAETAIARARYANDPRIAVDLGDARALPYADDTFDCVVAHQVLNLFPEIQVALAEVARVLRPGGHLLIASNRGWRNDRGAHWILLSDAAVGAIEREYSSFVWPRMGDMRIYDERGIAEIFAESGRWDVASLRMEVVSTRAIVPPSRVPAIYNRLYLFGTAPNKKAILEAVEARANQLSVHGRLEFDLPFRLVSVKKGAAPTPGSGAVRANDTL